METKTDAEIYVPKEGNVMISGKLRNVRPYSIKDVIGFTRELLGAFKNIKEQYPDAEFKEGDMSKYLPLILDESGKLIDLVAMAINKDGRWLEEQRDLKGVSELFAKICEVNDFGIIISNFQKGWSLLQKQKIM